MSAEVEVGVDYGEIDFRNDLIWTVIDVDVHFFVTCLCAFPRSILTLRHPLSAYYVLIGQALSRSSSP